MSDRQLHFLLIDSDPIFRLGLKVTLESIPDFQVIADVPTITTACQILTEILSTGQRVNLIILELGHDTNSLSSDLQLCQQLKVFYPHIPILLLTVISQSEFLEEAKSIGINGYCPKGTSIAQLVPIIQQVCQGGYYWSSPEYNTNSSSFSLPFANLRKHLRSSGINKINQTLKSVNTELNTPGVTSLDKAILAGQKRELLAARWLINHLLVTHQEKQDIFLNQSLNQSFNETPLHLQNLTPIAPVTDSINSILDSQSLQGQLFNLCLSKLQFPLNNITNTPLEIDCLQENKKRQLLQIIMNKFFQQLTDIRSFNFDEQQIIQLRQQLLIDLLNTAITQFFQENSLIISSIKLDNFLLEKSISVAQEMLYKIPLFTELINYIILDKDLLDHRYYSCSIPNSQKSELKAVMILENLIIQVANAVIQPLLNHFADVEIIKHNFYITPLFSTREIEKFRNNLSWKYTKNQYINEPQAIFESRYELLIFTSRGISQTSIYAPRNQELGEISGIPLIVTLLLEFADALNPRVQSLLSLLGAAIVFILTQVVGRGIGLIGRGIIQGLGNVSFLDKK